jgi:diguanylate cyclase (GGDEF)-like protein
MGDAQIRDESPTARGNHFSCSLTAVLLARVRVHGGDEAVDRLLRDTRSLRSVAYLQDIGNWVSYDEAIALFRVGEDITGDPLFARRLGEDAVRQLTGSPVAALLRSLGSPEEVYRQMAPTAAKFSTVVAPDFPEVGPGYAELRFVARDGFPRDPRHCQWTRGLLTQPTVLFGLPPAHVEHAECAADGIVEGCRYRVSWDPEEAARMADPAAQVTALEAQVKALTERLQSVFATAGDLISSGDLKATLARITNRAALEVRAPHYLLAVRPTPGGELHCHHEGFEESEALEIAERLHSEDASTLPDSWLVVPVCSQRHDYGHMVARYDTGQRFFPQERELLELYARYAATALDSATALSESERLYRESTALLELARTLASAGTSDKIARRLAEAVPSVVDCDGVGVYLWEEARGKLVRRALIRHDRSEDPRAEWTIRPQESPMLKDWLADPDPQPRFVGGPDEREEGGLTAFVEDLSDAASIVVPITTGVHFLGCLTVSVMAIPERLHPSAELLNRLSGVAAHATTALENGRLVDRIIHQARHDGLTGLANRTLFTEQLVRAVAGDPEDSETVTLFYLDLDGFKPINDTLGHAVGDQLLCAVAARLSESVRTGDTVARLGGDEFTVLVHSVNDPAGVDALVARLTAIFAKPFKLGEHELSLGASIGRAAWPQDAKRADALLLHADTAMYSAKRARHAIALAEANGLDNPVEAQRAEPPAAEVPRASNGQAPAARR